MALGARKYKFAAYEKQSLEPLHVHLHKLRVQKVRKVANIWNPYNQVPHLTQDTTRESVKNIIKTHKRELIGQPTTRQQ